MIDPAADLADGAGTGAVMLASIGACLALEAFFSGSEVALVSVDRSRIRKRAESGSASARVVQRMMERPERVLSTTLVGTNVCVVAGSFLANELFARRFGPEASGWAIVAMIPLILLFGEILPKTISRRHPESIALRVAMPLRAAMLALTPIVAVTSWVARTVARPFKARTARHPFVTREELRMILQADQRLALERDEASLVKGMLDFAGTRAREHMTPLVDVISLPVTASVADAMRLIHERGYSRLPAYTDRVDNVTGLVEAMDLIDAPAGPGAALQSIEPYIKKPFYVPETARIDILLDDFRRHQQEMAIVVDEYGSAVGVITLEDVIEQIVGDVLDEFDRPGRVGLERLGDGTFQADGRLRLDELERALDQALPRAGYETVAGLVAHLFQKVPSAGEALEHEGVRFTILEATQRTVRRVKVERVESRKG